MKLKSLKHFLSNPVVVFSVLFCILTFLVAEHPFFWDTVPLASRPANWFYENGFGNFLLPVLLDNGDHPTLGIYLATVWKVFGKTLAVSHFAMLPFLIGIVIQLRKIVNRFFPDSIAIQFAVILLVLVEPTLLSQSTLVSTDLLLIFFYLLSVNSILSNNRMLLAIALIGLGNISMRGSMMVVAIFICDFALSSNYSRQFLLAKLKNRISVYLPVIVITGSWHLYHLSATGWIGFHSESPWLESFEPFSSLSEFLHNLKMLIWLMVDYGKLSLWLIAGLLLLSKFRPKLQLHDKPFQLLILMVAPLMVLSPTKLYYLHLMSSRYYLPVFIFLSLFTMYLVFNLKNNLLKYSLFSIILASLITGHLWIYPERLSQNWDGTLAHLPYHELRKSMIDYIDDEQIPFESVGTTFPNIASMKYTDLTDDERTFSDKDLRSNKYVFYSNVFNEWIVDELIELHENWELEKEFSSMNIYVQLYKNPNATVNDDL